MPSARLVERFASPSLRRRPPLSPRARGDPSWFDRLLSLGVRRSSRLLSRQSIPYTDYLSLSGVSFFPSLFHVDRHRSDKHPSGRPTGEAPRGNSPQNFRGRCVGVRAGNFPFGVTKFVFVRGKSFYPCGEIFPSAGNCPPAGEICECVRAGNFPSPPCVPGAKRAGSGGGEGLAPKVVTLVILASRCCCCVLPGRRQRRPAEICGPTNWRILFHIRIGLRFSKALSSHQSPIQSV